MAAQSGAIVEIFHVATPAGPAADLWKRLHPALRDGEAVQSRSHMDDPSEAILQAARAYAVDLVVLTTHGRLIEPGRPWGEWYSMLWRTRVDRCCSSG